MPRFTYASLAILSLLAGIAVAVAVGAPAPVSHPCFGAPADYVAAFDGGADDADKTVNGKVSFREPRVFLDNQAWWVGKGGPDPLMAEHIHVGLCYPQGETINLSGPAAWPIKAQKHNAMGGNSTVIRGGDFREHAGVQGVPSQKFNPPWTPTSMQEVRFLTLRYPAGQVSMCGRRQNMFPMTSTTADSGRLWFNTPGFHTYVTCTGDMQKKDFWPDDGIRSRGWLAAPPGGNLKSTYVNMDVNDESGHATVGFKASEMDDPVPASWTISFSISGPANSWAVHVDPDLHAGSLGKVVATGTTLSDSVTLDTRVLTPGVHRVMLVANYFVPNVGTGSGAIPIPFVVAG